MKSQLNKTRGGTSKLETIQTNKRNKEVKDAIVDASQKRTKYRFS